MLKTKVKASSVTNLTDARYFAAWEVEWMGFNFDVGSESHIPAEMMKAISDWVDGVKIVGEFNLHTVDEIRAAIDLLNLDGIQVGMFTDLDALLELRSPVPVIKEIVIEKESSASELQHILEAFQPQVEAFLINFDKNGISWEDLRDSRPFSIADLQKMAEEFPLLISIDLPADILIEVVNLIPFYGLNFTGGEEEKVGLKSFDELDEIFETLEIQQ
ncbi:MAG: hypothetical protein DHS20C18_23850 [Saprospiraceae bacterium]|nr:MAG: hypothetical protein DHS20C18_23850 [Saprospiraceae bacterium]